MHNLTDRLASEGCAVVALTLATRYNHLGSFVLLKTLMLTLPHWWVKSCRGWAMGASGEEAWWSFSFPVVTYSFVLQTSVTCWVNYHMVLWNGKNSYFCLLSLDNWTCTLGCFRRQAFLFLTNMLGQFVLEGNLLQSRGCICDPSSWVGFRRACVTSDQSVAEPGDALPWAAPNPPLGRLFPQARKPEFISPQPGVSYHCQGSHNSAVRFRFPQICL